MPTPYNHELFRRDNKYYSFIVEERLNIGKIKITILKRNDAQKRIDMAEMYFPYEKFRAMLIYWKSALNKGSDFEAKYISGADGKRTMYFKIKSKQIGIQLFDAIITEKNNNYTGKGGFQLKSLEDIIGFFQIITTINHWEFMNINKLFNGDFHKREK